MKQLIVTKFDYDIIMEKLKSSPAKIMFNRRDAEELIAELQKARLVENEELPAGIVRLNSTVTIKDEKANKIMQLTVVTPEKADIKQFRISVLSPIGTALIGYRQGSKVSWRVPAGKKTFTILEVK